MGFGARLCAHCSVELATVRCGHCFTLCIAGSKVCGQCGSTLGLEASLGPTSLRCVRCEQAELSGVRVGEHDVAECLRCGGLFVEHEVMERITRAAEDRGGIRLRPLAPAESTAERAAYVRCPSCASLMLRKNFGERSGVIVDVCGKHGVWLDRDELALIVEFVDAGGLARLRERDRTAASIQRLSKDASPRPDPETLPSYDMVGSFLWSLFRDR